VVSVYQRKSVGHSFLELVIINSKAMYIPLTPKLVNYWATKHILPWLTCLKVDLAVIVVPSKLVPSVVEECGQAGVGGLIIISAGFKEAGEEGEKMVEAILITCRKYKMRLIGPNCLGTINPKLGMNATFASRMALPGNIAFISQSGALCSSILDWACEQNVGFSHFVSIGSMVDIGFAELIDYFGMDQETSCLYIWSR
jgi:acetyltransferase